VLADYKGVDREQEDSVLLNHPSKGKLLLPMGSMIVPMEPIDHLGDGNGDPPSSHATHHRCPTILNMAAVPLMKKVPNLTSSEFLSRVL
jgi:hypothetical protein